jgi:hypothetical protein
MNNEPNQIIEWPRYTKQLRPNTKAVYWISFRSGGHSGISRARIADTQHPLALLVVRMERKLRDIRLMCRRSSGSSKAAILWSTVNTFIFLRSLTAINLIECIYWQLHELCESALGSRNLGFLRFRISTFRLQVGLWTIDLRGVRYDRWKFYQKAFEFDNYKRCRQMKWMTDCDFEERRRIQLSVPSSWFYWTSWLEFGWFVRGWESQATERDSVLLL